MNTPSIMIIDDSKADRYVLSRDVKSLGYTGTVFEAENGKDALEFLTAYEENIAKYHDSFPPILIFLDINMPVMDGFEFLDKFSHLKLNDPRYQSVIIMMFTTSNLKSDINKANEYFVQEYFTKGEYTLNDLETILVRYSLIID